MDDYLFTLPEDERKTVKAFLLMQQERIENLEKVVNELQYGRSSKMWILQGFKSCDLQSLSSKMSSSHQFSHTRRICYHVDTSDVFIEFLDFKNKLVIEDFLKQIEMNHISIAVSQSVCSYYVESKWKYLRHIRGVGE